MAAVEEPAWWVTSAQKRRGRERSTRGNSYDDVFWISL